MRIPTPLLAFCLSSLLFTSCQATISSPPTTAEAVQPRLNKGGADLTRVHFNAGQTFLLKGQWRFWPGKLLTPNEVEAQLEHPTLPVQYREVPQLWSKLEPWDSTSNLIQRGTLALTVHLPENYPLMGLRIPNAFGATKVFIDSQALTEIGHVGTSPQDTIPSNELAITEFEPNQATFLLTMQVANFSLPYSGTWVAPTLGSSEAIQHQHQLDSVITSLIAGGLLFMGLYHLFLFFFRTEDKTALFFGIICLLMAIRALITGERILLELFPPTWEGWRISFVVEHLSAHLTVPLFYLFFYRLFRHQLPLWTVKVTLVVASIWAFLEIFTPPLFHQRFLSWYEYFLIFAAFYILWTVLKAFRAKLEGAGLTLIGLALLITTALNDVLLSNGVIQGFYMSSVGVFLYAFTQSLILSRRFSRLYQTVAQQTEHLKRINLSLERFIPHEVLDYLEKGSILDVDLGDFSERRMSVFFLDIRDFTTFSETLSPQDTFRFVNSFLKRIGPLIRENGGFVDKYLGDGFMALFPGDPDQAVRAALAIRRELQNFNQLREQKKRKPIQVGIGIHGGILMLGTIGENRRMDSTVISDTVNTASRLESLTKIHSHDILISDEIVKSLQNPSVFVLEFAGAQEVKGRTRKVLVYKVLNILD